MSVNPMSAYGAGTIDSSSARTKSAAPDGESTFADWLKQFQGTEQSTTSTGQSTSSLNTSTGAKLPVSLSNATAGFAAKLPDGLTIGVVALGPVNSSDLANMAKSVEQEVLDALGASSASLSWPDASSGTKGSNPATSSTESGPFGMYDLLPNGVELMGYSAGTTKGGPSMQDMTSDMSFMLTSLEKALNPNATS